MTAILESSTITDEFIYQIEIRAITVTGRAKGWQSVHSDRVMDEALAQHLLRVYRRGAEKGVEYRAVRRRVGEMEVVNW